MYPCLFVLFNEWYIIHYVTSLYHNKLSKLMTLTCLWWLHRTTSSFYAFWSEAKLLYLFARLSPCSECEPKRAEVRSCLQTRGDSSLQVVEEAESVHFCSWLLVKWICWEAPPAGRASGCLAIRWSENFNWRFELSSMQWGSEMVSRWWIQREASVTFLVRGFWSERSSELNWLFCDMKHVHVCRIIIYCHAASNVAEWWF